jgi:type I restriction enzyme S subunit
VSEFPLVKLSEVVRINPRNPDVVPAETDRVTFVPMAAVEAETGRFSSSETRAWSAVKKGYTRFQENDVLVAKITPCMENGKACVARHLEGLVGAGSTEFHVLRPITAKVEPEWVLRFVNQRCIRHEAKRHMSGAVGQQRVPASFYQDLQFPLPDLETQLELLERLEDHDVKIDATERALFAIQAKLKQARASILKAAVEGRLVETEAELAQRQSSCFESGDQLLLRSLGEREVQHNGESSKEQRSRRYKTPSSPDPQSVDGLRLPPGWALSSIEQISSGLRYSLCIGPFGSNLKVSDYCEEGVPLIFVRNIRAENFSIEQATFVTHVKAAELAAHMARPGDILITKMGDPPGDSAIYPAGFPEAVITADVIKLHVASTYSLRFILYALRSPFLRRQILSQTKGVAHKKVSLERFAKIPIPIPPFAEQERIADEVERRFSVLDQVEATVNASFRRCGQLRQAVLKRAFAG